MKTTITTFLLLLFWGLNSQNISINSSFGNNGVLVVPSSQNSFIYALDLDTLGNIYGARATLQSGSSYNYELSITKCSAEGTLDNGFGINGVSVLSIAENQTPFDIKVTEHSKIFVCGMAHNSISSQSFGFLVKLNPNGSLDTSFANEGVFILNVNSIGFNSIVLLNDDSIVLGGTANSLGILVKLNSNGSLATDFGNNGVMNVSSGSFHFGLEKTIVTTNNELLSVGFEFSNASNTKIAYCKTDTNGNFIEAFGNNGKVVYDLQIDPYPFGSELITQIKKGTNNSYYLGGNNADSYFILKINEDGSFDVNFANSGISSGNFPFTDFDLQENGKIVISGTTLVSDSNLGYSIIRLNDDGSFDDTFNNGSNFILDLSPQSDYMYSMKFTSANEFLIGGSMGQNAIRKAIITKLTIDDALSVDQKDKQLEFQIFPNPFKDNINISNIGEVKNVKMVDILGKQIEFSRINNTIHVDENLSAGIYFMKVLFYDGMEIIKKIVKE